MAEKRGLGKGIRALIPEASLPLPESQAQVRMDLLPGKGQVVRVPLEAIQPNRFQPRKSPDKERIQELANSIKESGLIYPLIIRKIEKSGLNRPVYELIAGERRFQALRLLGESEAPVIIQETSDREALELSLIENLQREDLNPVDQAHGFKRLIEEFKITQEEVAQVLGKDRATVANTLRILRLPPQVQVFVAEGKLERGHALALLALGSESQQISLASRVVRQGLSVRKAEQLVKDASGGTGKALAREARDPHLLALEQRLQRALGTKVEILHRRSRGWIRIPYYSLKDLDRLLGLLTAGI